MGFLKENYEQELTLCKMQLPEITEIPAVTIGFLPGTPILFIPE